MGPHYRQISRRVQQNFPSAFDNFTAPPRPLEAPASLAPNTIKNSRAPARISPHGQEFLRTDRPFKRTGTPERRTAPKYARTV